ncbi:uncharacterized protein LOC118766192 [Octopus sinensis]|uniref:Uncharacterized protein LOC118766192 n=1 Tax=Octopus sinensis TaxID=2607531 RepID=A0A7E6FC87_9MOLL|nr:uncharacterized protein LOC118766192 [Octopus sinensis]
MSPRSRTHLNFIQRTSECHRLHFSSCKLTGITMKFAKILQLTIFLFNYIWIASLAAQPKECKMPKNLKNRYQALTNAVVGKTFYLPSRIIPDNKKKMQMQGKKKNHPSKGGPSILVASQCPSKHINIYDESVFPQNRTEVRCNTKSCSGTGYQCLTLFSKITVLKRTHECTRGRYVYKPKVIHVATSCGCGLKSNKPKRKKMSS